MKPVRTSRKFKLFDIIEGGDTRASRVTSYPSTVFYNISNVIPNEMMSIDDFILISGIVTLENNDDGKLNPSFGQSMLIKVFNNQILDEYKIFTKDILRFSVKPFQDKKILISFGADIDEGLITKLKISDITGCLVPLNDVSPSLIQEYKIMTTDKGGIISQDNLDSSFPPLNDIKSITVNNDLSIVAIGRPTEVVIFQSKTNFYSQNDKKITIKEIQSNSEITFVSFSESNSGFFLFYSTKNELYILDARNNFKQIKIISSKECELNKNNIFVKPYENKFVMTTSKGNCITEESDFKEVGRWGFEGTIQLINYFGDYIVFFEKIGKGNFFAIFDPLNDIYTYYSNFPDTPLFLISDHNSIYILSKNEYKKELKITRLIEKSKKEKFAIFYEKKFYDTAYDYAKNLHYQEKDLAEIAKRHGDYLYLKGDFEGSIERYKKTINFLNPSYVIEKFLDGAKLDFLIRYLDELRGNEKFKKSCEEDEFNDYIALLMNCYIKQKQMQKMKEFLERLQGEEKLKVTRTAINVCKDTREYDLAKEIAEKSGYTDLTFQVILELEQNKVEALDFLTKLKDMEKETKLEIAIKYGNKFIETGSDNPICQRFMNMYLPLVREVCNAKNSKEPSNLKNISYSDIMSVCSSGDSHEELRKIIDEIIKTDSNCPSMIYHKIIELDLEIIGKYNEQTTNKRKVLNEYPSKIITFSEYQRCNKEIMDIIDNKDEKKNIDYQNLFVLCKLENFKEGILKLSEKLGLYQDLLQIFAEEIAEDFKKNETENLTQEEIVDIQFEKFQSLYSKCQKYVEKDPIFLLQILIYFLDQADIIYQKVDFEIKNFTLDKFQNEIKEEDKDNMDVILSYTEMMKNDTKDWGNISAIYNNYDYIGKIIKQLYEKKIATPLEILSLIKNHHYTDSNQTKEKKIIRLHSFRGILLNDLSLKIEKLKTDKTITEQNSGKIAQFDRELILNTQQCKKSNNIKCPRCNESLRLPFVFFYCGHSYHLNCLKEESDINICLKCRTKSEEINRRISDIETKSKSEEGEFNKSLKEAKDKVDFCYQNIGKYPIKLSNNFHYKGEQFY